MTRHEQRARRWILREIDRSADRRAEAEPRRAADTGKPAAGGRA